ncbi:2-hydroxychromene-2-carboxylate isomerase [Rhizobium giardinii]|uniref:2-hydroxychromene-2-carboxylate isomerase n=1 Tax=Rhizobium giardinii TaxID=56731 RepID=A0A7W8X8E8_9HYPH|nr:2-hydroxychromene-2-carboxylate isomerase [Rhizobium giardinii]
MTRIVDYFFSIGSPWSYIGFDSFVELAANNYVEIKPYLTTVVEENGGIFSRNRPPTQLLDARPETLGAPSKGLILKKPR